MLCKPCGSDPAEIADLFADAPDVYPMGMMGFLVWDVNSTDIGRPVLCTF